MAATAKITLNVTMFNALKDLSNANRFCIIDDPAIVDSANGRVYTINGDRRTLRIKNGKTGAAQKAKPINLEFTITPAGSYVVAGLIVDGGGFDGKGGAKNNFAPGAIDGNVVTLEDVYSDGKTYWEVLIGIQEVAGGKRVGVIDPGVENSEDA